MRRDLTDIEIVEDRSARCGPREGFLKLQRLVIRNRYADGTHSAPYPCDVVSRTGVDAVTVLLWARTPQGVVVGLRENLRPPVWFRRHRDDLVFEDPAPYDTLLETVAGILEPEDRAGGRDAGLRRRAAIESSEEVGVALEDERILDLGGASFPTPGIGDELVHFKAARVDSFANAERPTGDGSAMEEVGGLVVLPLDDAIDRARRGEICDMKTEIALVRLRDHLRERGER